MLTVPASIAPKISSTSLNSSTRTSTKDSSDSDSIISNVINSYASPVDDLINEKIPAIFWKN